MFEELYSEALKHAVQFKASSKLISGQVGAALLSEDGVIYSGVSINTPCSLGFCAEHSAVAALLLDRKSKVISIVAVDDEGVVMPPCGRCRQLILFLHQHNRESIVYIDNNAACKTINELMPFSKGA